MNIMSKGMLYMNLPRPLSPRTKDRNMKQAKAKQEKLEHTSTSIEGGVLNSVVKLEIST